MELMVIAGSLSHCANVIFSWFWQPRYRQLARQPTLSWLHEFFLLPVWQVFPRANSAIQSDGQGLGFRVELDAMNPCYEQRAIEH